MCFLRRKCPVRISMKTASGHGDVLATYVPSLATARTGFAPFSSVKNMPMAAASLVAASALNETILGWISALATGRAFGVTRTNPRDFDAQLALVRSRGDKLATIVEESTENGVGFTNLQFAAGRFTIQTFDRCNDRVALDDCLQVIDEFEIRQIGRYRVEILRVFLDELGSDKQVRVLVHRELGLRRLLLDAGPDMESLMVFFRVAAHHHRADNRHAEQIFAK